MKILWICSPFKKNFYNLRRKNTPYPIHVYMRLKNKIFSWLTLLSICIALFSYSPLTYSSSSEETYFIATAYYSPLKGQSRYTTGSYSWDVRLNGGGVQTASWKGVFPGLLAWPANYPFWTKIHFEGYWVGTIEDRWWAIVKAGERWHSYDRIDIWMWYGDPGLERALKWGTRKIKWKIVVPSTPVSLSFDQWKLWYLTDLEVNPLTPKEQDVQRLQEIFTLAWLYSGSISGKYDDIQESLVDFQLKHGVISSRWEVSAGWYGPKTRSMLNKIYNTSPELLQREDVSIFYNTPHAQALSTYKLILEYGDLNITPNSWREEIQSLQELLTKLWEFHWKQDGSYETILPDLLRYQKKIGLIGDNDDWGAGYFWNKTKSAMWTYYESLWDQGNMIVQYLSAQEKANIETLVISLRETFTKEEQRGEWSKQERERNLKIALVRALNRFENPKTLAKIHYIISLLQI